MYTRLAAQIALGLTLTTLASTCGGGSPPAAGGGSRNGPSGVGVLAGTANVTYTQQVQDQGVRHGRR